MLDIFARQSIERSAILHFAESLFHDHAQANAFRLADGWIQSQHDQQGCSAIMIPDTNTTTTFRFTSMSELVDARASVDLISC